MKTKQLLATISLLLTGCMVSFYVGRTTAPVETQVVVERCEVDHSKDYQAACVLSDICRIALDSPDLTWGSFEDLYWDYILNLDTDPSLDITWEQVHKDYCHQY